MKTNLTLLALLITLSACATPEAPEQLPQHRKCAQLPKLRDNPTRFEERLYTNVIINMYAVCARNEVVK